MEELEAGKLTECCDLLNTISNYPENKKCFDCCDNYSPRYLCTTFSTFVCSCCANIHHKEFGHTIKVLSVFSFTVNEIYVLKDTGNKLAASKWLARWRSDLYMEPDPTSATYKEDARKYMKAKYVEKRWVKVIPALPLPPGATKSKEEEPRGYDDVSPRRIFPDGAVPVELPVAQQHDDKSVTQPSLRDPYSAPVMYVPQPMYIPVNMGGMPMAYGYPQYHVAQPDASRIAPQPPQQPYHYGPLYTYPYDNMHVFPPPIMAEGISWPGASVSKKRAVTTVVGAQREPQSLSSSEELPAYPPGAIFRSVSDNSIVGHYIVQPPSSIRREPSLTCIDCNATIQEPCNGHGHTSDTKHNNNPATVSNKADTKSNTVLKSSGDTKVKIAGIMNKVAGFLSKKS